MAIVKQTIYISILIQVLSLLFGIYAYMMDTNPNNGMLGEIMLIENVVQAIEFTFYVVIAFVITNIPTKDLAKYRYIDWSITTPLMLITTLLYFVFDKDKQEKEENPPQKRYKINSLYIIRKNINNIIKMVIANAGMLLIGYLQEIGKVTLQTSNIVGFGCLIYSFYILYGYAATRTAQILFWVMFGVWSLYGVASNYNDVIKNTSYNILDIIAKNFYGIFLASMIMLG